MMMGLHGMVMGRSWCGDDTLMVDDGIVIDCRLDGHVVVMGRS